MFIYRQISFVALLKDVADGEQYHSQARQVRYYMATEVWTFRFRFEMEILRGYHLFLVA